MRGANAAVPKRINQQTQTRPVVPPCRYNTARRLCQTIGCTACSVAVRLTQQGPHTRRWRQAPNLTPPEATTGHSLLTRTTIIRHTLKTSVWKCQEASRMFGHQHPHHHHRRVGLSSNHTAHYCERMRATAGYALRMCTFL